MGGKESEECRMVRGSKDVPEKQNPGGKWVGNNITVIDFLTIKGKRSKT